MPVTLARFGENKTDPINYDEVHYLPEIAVGRWPVSTPAEARLVAGKTVAYEQSLSARSGTPPPRAGFVVTGGWVDSRQLMDELAGKLAGAWQSEKLFYADAGRQPAGPPPDHRPVHNTAMFMFIAVYAYGSSCRSTCRNDCDARRGSRFNAQDLRRIRHPRP